MKTSEIKLVKATRLFRRYSHSSQVDLVVDRRGDWTIDSIYYVQDPRRSMTLPEALEEANALAQEIEAATPCYRLALALQAHTGLDLGLRSPVAMSAGPSAAESQTCATAGRHQQGSAA